MHLEEIKGIILAEPRNRFCFFYALSASRCKSPKIATIRQGYFFYVQ